MPACMAHYQFGQDVLNRLDGTIRSVVSAYRGEYDCGLQGPDIFFFYRPYRRTWVRDYGLDRHNEPAVSMFAPMLEQVREKAALSCLIGLICHYVLDRCCHPYVIGQSRRYGDHQRIESAFDLFIMRANRLTEARYRYLSARRIDEAAVAALWPGMTARTIEKCVRAERRAIRVLDRRRFLELCEKIIRKPGALTPMTLPAHISERMAEHVRSLHALYRQALDTCLALIGTAMALMGTTLTGGAGFDLNYKGNTTSDNTPV